jgi:hypothetical protein
MPVVQFYKSVGNGYFATQLQYEVTADGDIIWTSTVGITGYIVLV